jgi:outer membrane receptor for ferrienterochelin and colicin
LDFYNVPNAAYFNYNLFATYKPNESLMFRLVHGKANRGSFILDAFYDQEINFGSSTAILRGNSNLNLTNVLSYEAGIRTPLALGLLMDVEVFRSEVSNFYTSVAVSNSNPNISESQLQNLPTKAVQNGATFALVFLEKKTSLQVNAYITYQKTSLSNFYSDKNGQVQYVDIEHEATPHFLGGMNLYWKYKKFSINGQSWYMGKQELNTIVGPRASQISADNLVINPYLGANLKVSYHLNSNWRMFINARNILNGGQVQSFMGDKLPTIVFAGLNLRW